MSRYARLTHVGFDADESDLVEFGEVGLDFLDKLTEGDAVLRAEAERGLQQKSVRDHICTAPSTELAAEFSSNLQSLIGYRLAPEQQKLQEHQNIENGNPNICPPERTTLPTNVTICSHGSTANGPLQQQPRQGGGGRGGDSPSGRWVERNIEERSGRWRTVGCESYHRGNSAGVLDNVNIMSNAPSLRPTFGQSWTPSIQRASHRDRKPAADHLPRESFPSRAGTQPQRSQPQEKLSYNRHSSSIDTRHCQRMSKESSPQECQFNAPIPGPEKRSLPSIMHPRSDASYGGSFSQERGPIFQRSISAREAPGLQRSTSTRETPGQRFEMSIENWMDHPASKSAHVSDETKHRVSFSLTESHEVETQKLREKFREPVASCKKVLQAKHQTSNQHPLRYNYEQPGFIECESEKENIRAGKAYTIYGMKEVKDCPKGSSGRHHPKLVRAFSLRENSSNHTTMPRAYSMNAGGRHLMPMECGTCGKGGIGIVFLGPPGDDANFCKACKSSSGSERSCGENKPPKKKKSIMDYCRNILKLPQKFR